MTRTIPTSPPTFRAVRTFWTRAPLRTPTMLIRVKTMIAAMATPFAPAAERGTNAPR